MTKVDKYTKVNLKHALKPKVGDCWQEIMCLPAGVVVDVTKFSVVVCEDLKETEKGNKTWDLSKLKTYTRKDFSNRYRYGRCGNKTFEASDDMSNIKNKFWCDVKPKLYPWIREEALKYL